MQYDKPFHLFNSSGDWIGFCLGKNVFDTDSAWRGWFPWDSADITAPDGSYLGTVVGNRLYAYEHKRGFQIPYYPGYPATPLPPERPEPVGSRELRDGVSDVNLKPALARMPNSKVHRLTGSAVSALEPRIAV